MNQSGAAASVSSGDHSASDASDASAPLAGIEYLDAWRAAVRPFPGSVPPFAGFCPVDTNEPVADRDAIAAAIVSAVSAIDALGSIDPSAAEPQVLAKLVEGVEQLRRMVDAAATDVAHVIDVSNPFRAQGYRNARTVLKQRAQLSGPEAYRRIQTARMRKQLPERAGAARTGTVGVAQSESMARVAANPHIDPDVLLRDSGMLLDDAINLPYEEFERNLRMWEALADPVGDDTRNERAKARREFNLHPRPDGGWNLTGFLPEPAGVEFAEIFGSSVVCVG